MIPRSILLGLTLAVATGCSGTLTYQVRSPIDIQADAKVVARVQDSQNHTQVEITVVKLAPPERVKPEGTYTLYVGWARPSEDASWARLGTLKYDADDGTGELTATANQTAFDLAISAEASGDADAPSEAIVFFQRVED